MRYEERFEAVLKSAASEFARRGYDRASIRDVILFPHMRPE